MLLTASIVTLAACLFARREFAAAGGKPETPARFGFWPLAFCMQAGVNAAFVSADLFNLYVTLELTTIAAAALVALSGTRGALDAALRYLMFALVGSLFYLAGVAVLYAAGGALDARLLAGADIDPRAFAIAAGLATAGLMAKMALFPLHAWLPPAHASAPAPASALLSALVVKPPFVILLRLWFEISPEAASQALTQTLGALGAAAVFWGSVMALRQTRLKLLIAYSTLAQLGYLFLVFPLAGGASAATPWGAAAWTGAVFIALAHMLAKAGLFLAAGAFVEARGSDAMGGLRGIARDLPVAAFAFGLCAVSLMGLPPSGGFIGKYLLLTSAFASERLVWAATLLLGGLLTAAYLFRPLGLMMCDGDEKRSCAPVSRSRQWIALALGLLAILLGLFSDAPFRLLQIGRPGAAAEGLS
jgi:formate hydrogenlyase subunit 3/multisubunit Na+/H+ antiporter MnhD subunit